MGPGQIFFTRAGSAIFGLGLDLDNFPQKNALGRVKKYPGRRQPRPLFASSQKYAWVRAHFQLWLKMWLVLEPGPLRSPVRSEDHKATAIKFYKLVDPVKSLEMGPDPTRAYS